MQTILVAQNVINAVQASISIHGDKDQERHGYLIRKLLVKVRYFIDFLINAKRVWVEGCLSPFCNNCSIESLLKPLFLSCYAHSKI